MNHQVTIVKVLAITILISLASCVKEKPDILIIGDSISIGYFPFVEEALGDKANIVHNPGNAQHTGTGLEKLEEWLGDTEWDLVAFNWGLWDLCYRHPNSKLYGNRDKINGTVSYTPEEYSSNLTELVERLKSKAPGLVFISTTYVPPGEGGRIEGSDLVYNNVARELMERNNIEYLDINSLSKDLHQSYRSNEGDVHFTKEGYRLLAEPIIEALKKQLSLK